MSISWLAKTAATEGHFAKKTVLRPQGSRGTPYRRTFLQKDFPAEGLLYLADRLIHLTDGLLYLAKRGPENGHPIEVLLLGLETPGDPEVLLSV